MEISLCGYYWNEKQIVDDELDGSWEYLLLCRVGAVVVAG